MSVWLNLLTSIVIILKLLSMNLIGTNLYHRLDAFACMIKEKNIETILKTYIC